ncbi:phenoloxidase-activating factor 2 [Teleopsis dalmanni]|uniref:phenoloxidase-activating factor 2 n=1 Tax=Teleopsis dalmanni TaxID=139649 RepID=UPI0018CD5E33|nr:phenoloxidase-activating factor 2 [Teleopsis dalmanni]
MLLTVNIFILLLSAISAQVAPQQNANIQDIVNTVFQVTPTATARRTGFNQIVTPEPVDPSKPLPNFTSVSGRAQCNCVPYHMCDPSTNSVTEDETFDGFGLIDLRADFNDPVCEHYLDVCCDNNRTLPTSLKPTPVENRPNRPTGCGIRNVGGVDFNITGALDNESGFGEFPWTIALLTAADSTYFCSGSLIHPRVVLTAFHCITQRAPNSFVARAGEWDTQTTRERLPYQERTIQKIIAHPQFNERNVANDFALLILSEAFVLDDHINVVCLPAQNGIPATGTNCYSTGWGKDQFGAAGRYSVIMKRVLLPIVEFNDCQNKLRGTRLGPKFALSPTFICAGGVVGIDTCQGDGGAPLSCPVGSSTDNRFVQSGIVAWGIGCNTHIPAAYANVASARDWIDGQMLTNGFDTATYTTNL